MKQYMRQFLLYIFPSLLMVNRDIFKKDDVEYPVAGENPPSLWIFSETAPTLELDVNSFIGISSGNGASFDEFVEDSNEKKKVQ